MVEGHAVDLLDMKLAAYAAAGITSCHESTKKIQVLQKLRLGMYAMLREASAACDIKETIRSVTEEKLDPRHVCLVTDDREPCVLLHEGHVDHVVRRAIEEGVDPVAAIQMATVNVAEHYECARELGSIAPARYADLLILDDLTKVTVSTVIADGRVVSRNGNLVEKIDLPSYPDSARQTMKLGRFPTLSDLTIRTNMTQGAVMVRAIGVVPGSIYTRHLELEAPVKNGSVTANVDNDVIKIAVFERHKATGNIGIGFINGLGIKEGAVGSTVGHDSHNLVVAGTRDEEMLAAARVLIDSGGGLTAVRDEQVLAHVPLSIAGLMSDKPVEVVSEQIQELESAWSKLGSSLPSPHVALSFTTLSVVPELKITDRGLLDTVRFKFVRPVVA
jgi:adenine deaminase